MMILLVFIIGVALLVLGFISERNARTQDQDREVLGLKGMKSLEDDPERRKLIAKRRWEK